MLILNVIGLAVACVEALSRDDVQQELDALLP
jgi:hypothetical protein